MKNLSEKLTHFRYKEKDQENFCAWFHPCFQTSRNVADLNDLYKYLDDEWFDDNVMETDD
ncbi:hypothetical protein [Sphingobacterium multivorum]|uniref:hypothetical protein n=1 Tax=Sphingobacterium multivorum TaxID=28454 RepID=UPI0031BAAE2C